MKGNISRNQVRSREHDSTSGSNNEGSEDDQTKSIHHHRSEFPIVLCLLKHLYAFNYVPDSEFNHNPDKRWMFSRTDPIFVLALHSSSDETKFAHHWLSYYHQRWHAGVHRLSWLNIREYSIKNGSDESPFLFDEWLLHCPCCSFLFPADWSKSLHHVTGRVLTNIP